MNSGIYQILNTANGKVYIGSSATIEDRWNDHKGKLSRGAHGNTHLQNAYNKYSSDSFEYFMIEFCCPIKEMLLEKEQFWMDALKVIEKGYNINPVAGSCLGAKRTQESKDRMSKAQSGEKHRLYGKTQSEETKKKISDAIKGEKHRLYGKPKEDHPNYGRKWTEETKQKMSKSRRGQIAWNKGKKMSAEFGVNCSKAKSKLYTYKGKTQNISQWSSEAGISNGTLSRRLREGWDFEQAITTPVRGYRK